MKHGAWKTLLACIAGVAMLGGCGDDESTPDYQLHVASPEWQDQIVYFVMTDRFDDGNTGNDDQGAGEFDRTSNAKYSGGDLAGVKNRLDYIKGLGATAVWITPPVANQWWDPHVNYGGYHGYWARDFMSVDKHMGSLDDYKALSDALHRNSMYLIQDVVVNHMANCFWYDGDYDPLDPTLHVVTNGSAAPACGPTRAPFNQWNPLDPASLAAKVFHWTPYISDYANQDQVWNYQLSDLDDLNTETPEVVAALKEQYAYWISTVGVDAFRVDTAFYVPQDFFKAWYHDADGIDAAAKATGREGFLAFGEGYASDNPYETTQQERIESYMVDGQEPVLPSMINFPMYRTAGDVFARGHPTAELGHRMASAAALHGARWHVMPSFLDNHDTDRFLAGGTTVALQQDLLFMMTTPGIPVIYQGTEQGFTEQRGSMFKGGFGSGNLDHFDPTHPLYQYIAQVAQLRKANPVLSRGEPTVLKQTSGAPGAFVYKMEYAHDGTTETALVLFNTADAEVLVDNAETGLADGAVLHLLYSLRPGATELVAGAGGKLTLPLGAREARVYLATGATTTVPTPGHLTLTIPGGSEQSGDFTVSGTTDVAGVEQVKIVVDGDLAHSKSANVVGGAFSATVDTSAMFDASAVHTVTAYIRTVNLASETATFTVDQSFHERVSYTDPTGDDLGPDGTYAYPTDASWGDHRQMDIEGVQVLTSARTLRLRVKTHDVTDDWNPQNGFDHVCFSVFIDLPGVTGASVMPQQSGQVPDGFNWDYKARVHGWSNALFSSAGASDTVEGTASAPAAIVSVEPEADVIQFTFLPAGIGNPATLDGVKIYITTWDYDGGFRTFTETPQPWNFSGGVEGTDPKVMDDTAVLTITND
ncbi:MAG: alpha-amylase family glycosyl hydrolase [Anaeromyxobacter sp.]